MRTECQNNKANEKYCWNSHQNDGNFENLTTQEDIYAKFVDVTSKSGALFDQIHLEIIAEIYNLQIFIFAFAELFPDQRPDQILNQQIVLQSILEPTRKKAQQRIYLHSLNHFDNLKLRPESLAHRRY